MTDDTGVQKTELERLRERTKKLAMEKSWLQLILSLMNRLSETPGLENTVDNMLASLVDVIGGTGASIYYWVDGRIQYVDLLGRRETLGEIDDPLVRQVMESGEFAELAHDFGATLLDTRAFSQAWTWAFPLKIGPQVVGVIRIENLHIGVRDLLHILPTFVNYAALILNNAIQGHSRLQAAYDQLTASNEALKREIQERMRYEREQRRAKEQAEAANRAKSVFLANMSHELRTPLNAVLGFSELMQTDPAASATQRHYLDIINRSGQHLLTLINDVLDMSKIEAGRVTLDPRPFDLGELVRDIVDMMRVRAESKGIALHLDQTSRFPRYVNADAPKLRQVIINLVGNAIKFTDHGAVSIHLDLHPDPSCDEENLAQLLCEVQDTGIGLAPSDLDLIFQPFVQVGDQTGQTGTGLGLTITHQFVQLMGGELTVESAPGRGSTFRFHIPVHTVEASEVQRAPASFGRVIGVAAGQPEYRILVVDDNDGNRLLLHKLLAGVGFTIREAANGQDAIGVFQTWAPHLIFMDRKMPVMDGVTAARRIRGLPGSDRCKIVAISADAFSQDRTQVLDSGIHDYISKPFRAEEVFDCLNRTLGVRFLYAEQDKTGQPATPILGGERLATLPAGLLAELRQAVEGLDLDATQGIVARIREGDPSLAALIQPHLDNYDFEPILRLLEAQAVGPTADAQASEEQCPD